MNTCNYELQHELAPVKPDFSENNSRKASTDSQSWEQAQGQDLGWTSPKLTLDGDSGDSTEESDNDNGSQSLSPQTQKLNINSREFHLKSKKTEPESLQACQSGSTGFFEGSQENSEFGNVESGHPKSMNQKKRNFRNKERPSYSELQEATIKKPRKRFNCKQEKEKFVESYKMKKKTELCKNWELTGNCKFGDDCAFAHGNTELVSKNHIPENYKTKLCKQFHEEGCWSYGHRCQFLHLIIQKKVNKFNYCDILKENIFQYENRKRAINHQKVEFQLVNHLESKRLRVFDKICKSDDAQQKRKKSDNKIELSSPIF